ncbi:hypothetical protein DCS_06863 [Drechmeria coniospora]|uniref:Clr5 domain-containing protein n=1 Tax=Drechmeria coniospora TaxID=98403 RepID=A0A151GCR6_DRECN|nr:hypothetical protein DCS_06863 [Drechmeria coniospora]KYK54902.1 hypothetical protein DCS_06863 [Drechmeria coniospora]
MTLDWESRRGTISKLYKEHTLEIVMEMMRNKHGFHASRRAYNEHLAKWGVTKYNKNRSREKQPPLVVQKHLPLSTREEAESSFQPMEQQLDTRSSLRRMAFDRQPGHVRRFHDQQQQQQQQFGYPNQELPHNSGLYHHQQHLCVNGTMANLNAGSWGEDIIDSGWTAPVPHRYDDRQGYPPQYGGTLPAPLPDDGEGPADGKAVCQVYGRYR